MSAIFKTSLKFEKYQGLTSYFEKKTLFLRATIFYLLFVCPLTSLVSNHYLRWEFNLKKDILSHFVMACKWL